MKQKAAFNKFCIRTHEHFFQLHINHSPVFSKCLLYTSTVLYTEEPQMKSHSPSLPGADTWRCQHSRSTSDGECLSASEHIFLISRCRTPITSAIRRSMNHLMEHWAACSVPRVWPQKILFRGECSRYNWRAAHMWTPTSQDPQNESSERCSGFLVKWQYDCHSANQWVSRHPSNHHWGSITHVLPVPPWRSPFICTNSLCPS